MSGRVGSITTDIIADGLIFNMDAANRASYPAQRTLATAESGSCYNTIDLTQSGSFISDPQFVTQPISASSWVFDGVDDYIDIGSPSIGTGKKTIFMWINPTTTTYDDRIISNIDNANFGVRFATSNVEVWGNSWGSVFANPSTSTWAHVCFVLKGDATITGYLNGVEGSTISTVYNMSQLGIGARVNLAYGDEFHGKIANCQIYNRALSSNEVLHNYNALKGRFS